MNRAAEFPKRIHIKIRLEQWKKVQAMREADKHFSISEMFRQWFDEEYMGASSEQAAPPPARAEEDTGPGKVKFQFNLLNGQ